MAFQSSRRKRWKRKGKKKRGREEGKRGGTNLPWLSVSITTYFDFIQRNDYRMMGIERRGKDDHCNLIRFYPKT